MKPERLTGRELFNAHAESWAKDVRAVYDALINEGFTNDEALELVKTTLEDLARKAR